MEEEKKEEKKVETMSKNQLKKFHDLEK